MNAPANFWKLASGFLGVLIALAAVFIVKELKSISYIGADIQPTDTISVDGTGDAVAVPDIATFSFTVTETAKTVADAQTQATAKSNAATKAVTDLGVDKKDIQTTYYSINPHYDYQPAGLCAATYCPPNKQVLTGYDVSQSTQVKLHDLSKAGTLLTALGSLNVENLNGPSFAVDQPDAVQAEARDKAISNAQDKAKKLAGQLGVRLVRIVSFSENNGGYPRPMIYGMGGVATADAKSALAPEVSPGEQKVTSNVNITYEIQ